MKDENVGQVMYGVVDRGVFGLRVISGLVTGVRFTPKDPVYTIEFENNRWTTPSIAKTEKELIKLLKVPDLKEVAEKHNLTINFPKE